MWQNLLEINNGLKKQLGGIDKFTDVWVVVEVCDPKYV